MNMQPALTAAAYPMFPGPSIDTGDPKRAHLALLLLAIAGRILHCLLDAWRSNPDAVLGAAPEALGKLKDLLLLDPHHT